MKTIECSTQDEFAITAVCPICKDTSHRLFQKQTYWIRRCDRCHHRFAELQTSSNHVSQVYGDQYFFGGGAGYPNYLAEATLLRQHGQWYGRLLSQYVQAGTILEIGAAAGFMLQGFFDMGWHGSGIEPNPRMAEYARMHLNLPVEAIALEHLSTTEKYDVVSMIQVVAHFFDLQQAFHRASDCTKAGGFWLIETWNRNSWMARILGKYWHEYSPPSVLQWFSPEGICQLAAQHGFQEVARGRPAKWLKGAHAKSLLHHKFQDIPLGKLLSRCLNVIPDHLAIPYPAEDLFWILLQKSSH